MSTLTSFWVTKRYPVKRKDGSTHMFNFFIGTSQVNMMNALERVMGRKYSTFIVKEEKKSLWICRDPQNPELEIIVEMRKEKPVAPEGESVSYQDLRIPDEPILAKLPKQFAFNFK